jgi:acetylglutamate kinase
VRILVKVGGAQLEQPAARAELARSVAAARQAGHELALVHGGGNQIRQLVQQLGLEERYHEGLRVTDAATADVVLMVLAGLVNKQLVHELEQAGVRAAGLCGADGASFQAQKNRSYDVDLGYVGDVAHCDARLIEALLAAGFLPVIATAAPLAPNAEDAADHFYNINADLAAGPLARTLHAEALLFLTDVQGVLDARGERLEQLTPKHCDALRAQGVIHGGMLPKVHAALSALAENRRALIKIAPASGPDAVLRALQSEVGTRFSCEDG